MLLEGDLGVGVDGVGQRDELVALLVHAGFEVLTKLHRLAFRDGPAGRRQDYPAAAVGDREEPAGGACTGPTTATGPMIRAVAVDVMDTALVDPFREALVAATGVALDELLARRDPTVYPAFERGELDEDAYWDHYARLGIEVDPDRFHRVRRHGIRWMPGMARLLDDLAGVVVRVAASNYPHWIDELASGPLADRFEMVVASCHLGVRKPDPAFFEALLARLGLSAIEVLFIDDREANVEGARRLGLRAHRFVDAATLRGWLVEQGVAVPPEE